jgi:N-acetylmuramoyl-L-alanine amidase
MPAFATANEALLFPADCDLVADVHPSPNIGERNNGLKVCILIMHYTGMASAAKAIDWLARPESRVSCHYVVAEDGRITQMVPEAKRAWHAGVSYWQGETDINSKSVGIEIQNSGHEGGYSPFPDVQMRAVRGLSLGILARHGIRPEAVLAHSDIAPGRKIDPGEKFDWAWLAHAGVGHWVAPVPVQEDDLGLGTGPHTPDTHLMQRLLARYGYETTTSTTFDPKLQTIVREFQRHFRPARVDGRIDASTLLTMQRLIAALPKSGPRLPPTPDSTV